MIRRRMVPSKATWAAIVVAAAAYALMNELMVLELIRETDRSLIKLALYWTWLACGLATFLAFFVAARIGILLPLGGLIFVSLAVNYAYPAIAHAPLTVDVIEWLPAELGQLGNASREYAYEIALSAAGAAALLAVFLVVRWVIRRGSGALARIATHPRASLFATAAFGAFHFAGLVLQPPNSVAETNLYVFGLPSLVRSVPSPSPVDAIPAHAPVVDKVVLIIDESITREAYEKVVAPHAHGLPVIDFGEAASTTNCSAPSNALLRWGLDRSRAVRADYDPRTSPTIWAYAHAAGFTTTLIDGQSKGEKQNFLSPREFALIDAFVPSDAGQDTDVLLARKLNELLRRPTRDFIVVVKKGAHFPYEMNYPRAELPPEAPRPSKYAAAVAYSTGAFFETLARDAPFDRSLLIYTSDHGQDLAKRAPHCNSDPSADEYSVPLLAITASRVERDSLAPARLFDHAGHLHVFSTLLEALGYDNRWVEAHYGAALDGSPGPYLTFVNRGWQGQRAAERHTVRAREFIETRTFPHRAPGESRHEVIDIPGVSARAPRP